MRVRPRGWCSRSHVVHTSKDVHWDPRAEKLLSVTLYGVAYVVPNTAGHVRLSHYRAGVRLYGCGLKLA